MLLIKTDYKKREQLLESSQKTFDSTVQFALGSIAALCASVMSSSEVETLQGKTVPEVVQFFMELRYAGVQRRNRFTSFTTKYHPADQKPKPNYSRKKRFDGRGDESLQEILLPCQV